MNLEKEKWKEKKSGTVKKRRMEKGEISEVNLRKEETGGKR